MNKQECATEMKAEAARVARLRDEIARRMAGGLGCCVQHKDGRVGVTRDLGFAPDTIQVATAACSADWWPLSALAGPLVLEEGK